MLQVSAFAVYITNIHTGLGLACSSKKQTSTQFCSALVLGDAAFNGVCLWSMREVRCQLTVAMWSRFVCAAERSSVSLQEKDTTFVRIRVFWYTGTMNWSIVCSLLLCFLRTWHPLFCSMIESMFVVWPNAVILNVRLDIHLSCCAAYWQIASMTVSFLITVRVCSVKSTQCLMHWYFSTLPYFL